MNLIKESDFRKEIKSSPRLCYLFFGEEDYMKSFAMKLAIESISPDPSLSFFNEIKFDSLSFSTDALLDSFMPLPMMADKKIITVTGLDFNSMKQKEMDALSETLGRLEEYDYNTVIINASSDKLDGGSLPKRPSSLLKKLGEIDVLTLVYFEKNTPAKLSSWVGKHFEHNGVRASAEICSFVIDYCGRDMFNLASETDKIAFYVLGNGRQDVTKADVLQASTPALEYDTFAFTNAIGSGKRDTALNILRDFKLKKADPILILSEITRTVCEITMLSILKENGLTLREISDALNINEYRASILLNSAPRADVCKKMIARCRVADLELKSTRDGYAVLEKLICTI